MARLLGPDLNSRLAYVPAAGVLSSAAGMPAVVYANPTGSTLADIQIYNGTSTPAGPVPNSTLTVNSDSFIPLFWYPENVDTVYIEVNGGTRTAANADYDARIDDISGYVNGPLISTGLVAGGGITINVSNPKAIDIAPYIGFIVDYTTNPFNPTVTRVTSTATQTVTLNATAQTRILTWWLIDSSGAFIQQDMPPTNEQRRTHIQLGATLYDSFTGVIFLRETVPTIAPQVLNQFYDLAYALSGFTITGNVITPNGANLFFNKSAGRVFSPSLRYITNPNNPHVISATASAPLSFRHATQSPNVFSTLTTTVDVTNYDVNGVITPIGGGASRATILRAWFVPLQDPSFQYIVQYGQTIYNTIAEALNAVSRTNYVVNPTYAQQAVLLGHIIAIRTATNLSDTNQAVIISANAKFTRP